jgi:hypothetical protein
MDLTDVYSILYPTASEHTFLSAVYNNFFKINCKACFMP